MEPAEATDKMLPTDPTERMEPADASDMIDPNENADWIEPAEKHERMDEVGKREQAESDPADGSFRLGMPSSQRSGGPGATDAEPSTSPSTGSARSSAARGTTGEAIVENTAVPGTEVLQLC